jgi:hypothetical protein
MIRDLTKSTLSFSWAMSLLGMKQAANLFRPGQQSGDLMPPMTQVAVDQLDHSMKGLYRTGDNLQACAVDMAFAWMNPVNWFNPNAWMRPFAGVRQGSQRQDQGSGQGCCGQQSYGAPDTTPGQSNMGYGGNGFTQAAAGFSQAIGRVASGFTQAMGQATTGIGQAVTGSQHPNTGTGTTGGASAPVNQESAAAGWGPMPGDR